MPQGPLIPEQVPATAPRVGQRVGDRDNPASKPISMGDWDAATPISMSDWNAAKPLSAGLDDPKVDPASAAGFQMRRFNPDAPMPSQRDFDRKGWEAASTLGTLTSLAAAGPALRAGGRLAMSTLSARQVPTGFYDLATGQPVMEAAKGVLPSLRSAAGAVTGAASKYGPSIAKESARAALGGATYAALLRMLGGR